jgi:hypothetical protein
MKVTLPKLTERQILQWAKAFHRNHGFWHTRKEGPIPRSHGETWCAVDLGLKRGGRRLKGGVTLSQLIRRTFGIDASRLVRPKKFSLPSSRRILRESFPKASQ